MVSRLRLVKPRHALSAPLHARWAPAIGSRHDLGNVCVGLSGRLHRRVALRQRGRTAGAAQLDDQALLSEWGPSDSRGVSLLLALALVAAISGFAAYFETQDVRWAFGALVIIGSWLYAFFVMSPLDNQIRSLRGGEVSAARALVRQWGIVKSGLTAIGVVAVLIFLWAD